MNFRPHLTLYRKEVYKIKNYATQTVLNPIISISVYMFIMGQIVGQRIGSVSGIEYSRFIIPGLLLLYCTNYAFNSGSICVFVPRNNGTIYELKIAPISISEVLIVFMSATVTKSLLLSFTILFTAMIQSGFHIENPVILIVNLILIISTFSLIGLTTGLTSKSSDISQIVPMIMTPLILLGGTYFSIEMLPESLKKFLLLNPFYYLIESIRFGISGISSINIIVGASVNFLCFTTALLFSIAICSKSKVLFN